jgi:hypothetical protein
MARDGNIRAAGFAHLGVGAAILATGFWCLWRDIAPVSTSFYVFAWWGIIFLLDGFCALKRGGSLMTTRRAHVPYIMVTSVTFWVLFELLNARFHNWYYIGTIPYTGPWSLLAIGAFGFLAFSTVFMGMFEMHDALCATGVLDGWHGRRRQFPRWGIAAVQLTGALMAVLAIARPFYLAPLIWGSLSFLADPVNHRLGARSILRDIENGEWGVVARLLLAGLASGIVWESANFFAPQKWIYTVRGLESFKLFEMPLLGFLGFPGLMLDVMAAYSLFTWAALGNRSWENPADVRQPMPARRALPRWVFAVSLAPQLVFWGAVGILAPIGSLELELTSLPVLTAPAVKGLELEGIRRPIQLLREADDPVRREQLRRRIGYDAARFGALLRQADLYTFKGIGSWYGPLLNRAGIERVDQLALREPNELCRELRELAATEGRRSPTLDMVRVWVLGARSRGVVQRAHAG